MGDDYRESVFKNLATLLSLLLPIAQVFASFLPPEATKMILFDDSLLFVSITAALIAYILIVAFKSTVWFTFTFQRQLKRKYDEQQLKISTNVLEEDELKNLIRDGKIIKSPYYVTPLNIYYFLLPTILVCALSFLFLGLFFESTTRDIIIFLQAALYIFLISLVSLILGVFYINDVNRVKRERNLQESWEKIKILLFTRQAVPQFPHLEFVAESEVTKGNQTRVSIIISVNKEVFYSVETDHDYKQLFEIAHWDPVTKQVTPLGGINNERD